METEPKNDHDHLRDNDISTSHPEEDRMSILHWVLMFIVLGIVAYCTPMLLALLPR